MGDKSSEAVVLCYTSIIRRERERELWIVLARRKRGDRGNHNGDQPSMARMINLREDTWARSEDSESGCLELTNPTSIRLVHTRRFQVTLLEEDTRTDVRRHGTTEVGIVRKRQGLQGARERSWYSLSQVVVVQMELGESGEG